MFCGTRKSIKRQTCHLKDSFLRKTNKGVINYRKPSNRVPYLHEHPQYRNARNRKRKQCANAGAHANQQHSKDFNTLHIPRHIGHTTPKIEL